MPVLRFIAMAIAKSFSKLFGLATITFFGRQPSRDDDKVAGVGIAALIWLSAAVMTAFPATAEVLAPPIADDESLVRWVGGTMTLAVPPIIGLVIARLHNRADGPGPLPHLLLGYGYAAVISVLVVALVVVVPVVKASYIIRRFDLERIAIMIERGQFAQVRDALLEILGRNGVDAQVDRANPAIRWVFGALTWVEGHIFRRGLSTDMAVIRGELRELGWFEITLHASDITIIGHQAVSTRLVALLSEELDVRTVYFSWDDASQQVEDAIRACRADLDAGRPCDRAHLHDLTERLRTLELSREEWNALRRQLYLVERDNERLRADLAERARGSVAERSAGPRPHEQRDVLHRDDEEHAQAGHGAEHRHLDGDEQHREEGRQQHGGDQAHEQRRAGIGDDPAPRAARDERAEDGEPAQQQREHEHREGAGDQRPAPARDGRSV